MYVCICMYVCMYVYIRERECAQVREEVHKFEKTTGAEQ